MDMSQTSKWNEESCNNIINLSYTIGSYNISNLNTDCAASQENGLIDSNSSALQLNLKDSVDLIRHNEGDDLIELEKKKIAKKISAADNIFQNNQTSGESLEKVNVPTFSDLNNFVNSEQNYSEFCSKKSHESEAVIKVFKPLCANYRSDSDTESVHSENASYTISTNSTEISSESESESDSSESQNSGSDKRATELGEKKSKKEVKLLDLPSIEDLRISVSEDACVEIGTITSIVDTLVVIESYKGTPALDLDTVLFLNYGKRTLGKVFEILGPITEPVYAVRFNSQEHIKNLGIDKGLKVYFAPKTEHTNFVFMSEVLKNRGSDASWKDNTEAPPEFQDFSDDEEERLHNRKKIGEINADSSVSKEQNISRRSFYNIKPTSGVWQASRFRNPSFSQRRWPNFQRNPSRYQLMAPPSFPRPTDSSPTRALLFPYNSAPPHMYHSPRFSGSPFPSFENYPCVNRNQNFQQPFDQQRTHAFAQVFGPWGTSMFKSSLPPPPPPPPSAPEQSDQPPTS